MWFTPAGTASSTKRGGAIAVAGASERRAPSNSPAPSATPAPEATPATSRPAVAARVPRFPRSAFVTDDASEVPLGLGPGRLAAERAHLPATEVVGGDVDPTVQARDARLIGGVVIRRPLQRHVLRRTALDLERARRDRPLGEPAWEVLAAGDGREHLRSGPTESAVAGHVPGEGRRHERGLLVRHPLGRSEEHTSELQSRL